MKIAIPSNDGTTVSRHFGRTRGFMIYTISDGKILSKEYKTNDFTGHARGLHHEKEHQHSHAGIFNALGDCEVVIAGGMGRRLYDDFKQKNIEVYVTRENNLENAIGLFLKQELDNQPEKCCNH